MKYSSSVSSSRRKQRKMHFSAPSSVRRHLLSAKLSKELRLKHDNVRSMPIRKDDEVKVLRGKFKDDIGKVTCVYRKKMCIHLEGTRKEKANGASISVPIHPSNCEITKLKLDRSRKKLIDAKKNGKKRKSPMDKLD